MLGKLLIGLGVLFGFMHLAKANPSTGAGGAPRLPPKFSGSPGPLALPEKSEPATDLGAPTTSLAIAESGRNYHVWMFPPATAGTYTIARLVGSQAWLSFIFHAGSNKRIPGKTNVSDPALLSNMRADWLLVA